MQKVHLGFNMIYLDHASSSKVEEQFVEAAQNMLPRFFANPNAQHMLAHEVNMAMENSRKKIAKLFQRSPNEVIFTASGSEANNLAIKGIALANMKKGKHIISVKTEHLSVLNSLEYLREIHHFDIDYCHVDQFGNIDIDELSKLIREDTIMVSMMAVNNEIATIMPIQAIQTLLKEKSRKIVFVVDGVAGVGKIDHTIFDVDVFTFSQHKLGGLSGSGCVVKKQHIEMIPLIHGGQQEHALRAGTPFAIANILLADVLEHALHQQKSQQQRIIELNNYLISKLQHDFSCKIVSSITGSPYIVSFIQENVHSSVILNGLSAQHVYVSSHSACASQTTSVSHVLLACGYSESEASKMIRVSFHYDTSIEEVDGFLQAYKKVQMYVK